MQSKFNDAFASILNDLAYEVTAVADSIETAQDLQRLACAEDKEAVEVDFCHMQLLVCSQEEDASVDVFALDANNLRDEGIYTGDIVLGLFWFEDSYDLGEAVGCIECYLNTSGVIMGTENIQYAVKTLRLHFPQHFKEPDPEQVCGWRYLNEPVRTLGLDT